MVGSPDGSIRCQLGFILSVRWLFDVGSVPSDFFTFSNLFAKIPILTFYRPLSIGRDPLVVSR